MARAVEAGARPPDGCVAASVWMNDWWLLALAAGVVGVLAAAAALLWAPSWPEMGTRYDAPNDSATADRGADTNLDIWKALDEGKDPTA